MKVRKKAVLCAILAGIMLSTATPSLKLTVFADSTITETEALDKAVAFETVHTVEHLAHQALPIFPQTLETYNAFVHYLKD